MMAMNITEKILSKHLVNGVMKTGSEIGIKIDQTLTQDSTGTMAYLEFESIGLKRVKTELSVAYVDHNMLQQGFENADDHKFIQTAAQKFGIVFSKPGNGICHQLHLERFAVPGKTLLGSDSHTPTCGGIGMLAVGAGGMDVAVAMGGGAYYINMPQIINIKLLGRLKPWVSAKDIILYILKLLTVKGGVGKILEYTGDGVKALSVTDRATIANMGAELGATASIFPSDEKTLEFLISQGRAKDYVELIPDEGAVYSETIEIELDILEPMAAAPHSPDNVIPVRELGKVKVDQVAIGSCTNSSYTDLMRAAEILKANTIHPDVSLVISPGSKQVLSAIAESGALKIFLDAGARILECGCGPCIGMGQAPRTNAVSVRTFNRNFEGRCGTASAGVYIVSPETAALTAIRGYIAAPMMEADKYNIDIKEKFHINNSLFIFPNKDEDVEIIKGPNIKEFPINKELGDELLASVALKAGDNITTDHIVPSSADLLPLRSNIPELSKHCYKNVDPDFGRRATELGAGIIVGGSNYGQGSSREHAALVPLYLGIKAVIAVSFARIHRSNLINSGIVALVFKNENDYIKMSLYDKIVIENIRKQIINGERIIAKNLTTNDEIELIANLSGREKEIILFGGLLNYTKNMAGGNMYV